MMLKRVCSVLLLGAALVGCNVDEDGEAVTPTVVAGLRYVNIVPDAGAFDARIVDVVGDAPNTVNATFRTGGAPYGVSISGLPAHTAVLAGTRRIRVFPTSTDPAVASTILLDFTYDFQANTNYTVFLYGYSAGGAPAMQAVVVEDSPGAIAAGQVAVRAVNMAPTLAPSIATAGGDVYVDGNAAGSGAPVGAPTFSNVGAGTATAYVTRAAGAGRAVLTEAGGTTTVIDANFPTGTAGTSSSNPVWGLGQAGTAITVVLAPASVVGSPATSFATPGLLFLVDAYPPRTAP